MFDKFDYFNRGYIFGVKTDKYNPYINYSWSQTLTVGGNQQIKDSGTAGLNLQQFFGQGCWFNGIDMSISIGSIPVSNNMTIIYNFVPTTNSRIMGRTTWDAFVGFSTVSATEGVVRCRFTGTDTVFTYRLTLGVPYSIALVLKPDVIDLWVNGILRESVSHTYTFAHPLEFIGRNSTAFANCVIKDIYVYNKHLTQTEIEKYTNQPNQFFMDSLEDNSCILAMPMCEKNNLVRNYKNNTDYTIANYLTTCRTNAQMLPYGLQTSGFKRDSNGLILSKSIFLECDGVGIATRVGHNETVKVKTTVNPSSLVGTVLSGGVSLLPTGMTINEDNIITLENQTPTITVAFGDGFNGTIKEYKEEK